MKLIFILLTFPLLSLACQKANVSNSVMKDHSRDLSEYYDDWRKEWEAEFTERSIGYTVSENSKFAKLASFNNLISANVSDAVWGRFICEKIRENISKPWNGRLPGYEYLAIGVCRRFDWSVKDVLVKRGLNQPGQNEMLDYARLPEVVCDLLQKSYK